MVKNWGFSVAAVILICSRLYADTPGTATITNKSSTKYSLRLLNPTTNEQCWPAQGPQVMNINDQVTINWAHPGLWGIGADACQQKPIVRIDDDYISNVLVFDIQNGYNYAVVSQQVKGSDIDDIREQQCPGLYPNALKYSVTTSYGPVPPSIHIISQKVVVGAQDDNRSNQCWGDS